MTKKLSVLLTILLTFSLSAFAQVTWDNAATGKIDVNYSLVSAVPGAYTYNFTISNTGEALPIWLVMVFANSTISPVAPLSKAGWIVTNNPNNPATVGPLGETQAAFTWSGDAGWPSTTPNGLLLGETFSGFSLTTAALQNSFNFVAYRQGEYGLGQNGSYNFTYGGTATTPVPEPSTYGLLGAGALGLLGFSRRFRRRQA